MTVSPYSDEGRRAAARAKARRLAMARARRAARRGQPAFLRPQLPSAYRPVWRGPESLQLGLDPARAVVLDPVTEGLARSLLAADGSRTEGELLVSAADRGVDPDTLAGTLDDLRATGALIDERPPPRPRPTGLRAPDEGTAPVPPGRLYPDLASLALLTGGVAAARSVLARRRESTVLVDGLGRIGSGVATLLAAAGVGRVRPVDAGAVTPADLSPAGFDPGDLDRSREHAGGTRIRRSAPEARTDLAGGRPPHLIVLCSPLSIGDTDLLARLHDTGLPHLAVAVRETTAVVGPLVRPGLTSCLRCADLHRADRDPDWPLVAAQLAVRRRQDEPCDVVLATLAAAVGAMQALAYLDGGTAAATENGTLELALPDHRIRRRSWPAHPRCHCDAL